MSCNKEQGCCVDILIKGEGLRGRGEGLWVTIKAAGKRNSQLSEHNTNLFDVIQRANENSTELMGENLFSHATSAAKLRIKQISSLLEYFSQRVRMYVH